MNTINSDKAWNTFGKKNAYFGVLTHEEYKDDNLTPEHLAAFFETGTTYVSHVFETIAKHIDADFNPQKVLDFGCGTGRLVIPFAKKSVHATGLDISSGMLEEAKRNAEKFETKNVAFYLSDDALSAVGSESFDLVNSYIVLQHINVERGMVIIEKLIEKLNPKGVGVLHVTYHSDKTKVGRVVNYLRYRVPFLNNVINVVKSRPFSEPLMQMNAYNLNEVFFLLQKNGIKNAHLEYEAHGDFWGVRIYFQKP